MRKKSIGSTIDNVKSSMSTAYQRGNNRDGSPHYVFLYSDDDDDDDDDGNHDDDDESIKANKYNKNIPLQIRNNELRKNICPRKVEVITVTLKPEDTLQALALRYRCTISELKRINNIHKENEIFARRVVKVPVSPFSILTEIDKNVSDNGEEEQQQRQNESTNKTFEVVDLTNSIVGGGNVINNERKEIPFSSSTSDNNDNYNISNNSNNEDNINNIILNSLSIDPLRNDVMNNDFDINHSENDELLSIDERGSTPEARVIELFGCSGADWGLTWIHLLGASLLLGFVIPVIYYLSLTEDHQYIHIKNSTGS